MVMRITRDYNRPVIEITESGCSYADGPDASGVVHDSRRIAYHREYLAALERSISEGADVRGYHAWSLLDNFEWADGFGQRFGLAYVDFKTQQRTIKDSGRWYAKVAAENRVGACVRFVSDRRSLTQHAAICKAVAYCFVPSSAMPRLFLLHHEFAVLHFHGANVIRKLQPVAFLGQFLLQRRIHQRYRNTQVAHFEFRGLERGVAILLAEVPRNRYPNIFAGNFRQELAVYQVAVES